ncbi:SAMHD1 [Scenedesmus sp. PABB004]|nr:SAMHD1 [Scenedesmus sp. PABB004]
MDRAFTPSLSQQDSYAQAEEEHRRTKTFNDNIHGHILLHRASVAIIDTPEFQRLRHLKQLGLTYYIYPGASHNRFEHSLGVAHLATLWGQQLIGSRGSPDSDGWTLKNFEPEDRACLTVLQLAGLCHDLGHGPFSHVFEKELLPKLFPGNPDIVREWHHEAMSNRIFDHIIGGDADNDIDLQALAGLSESDASLVKALMHGSTNPAAAAHNRDAPWLFDIVANKRNGIDVDKFDYLLRDSKMCGVGVPLDHERLMLFSRLDRDASQVIFKMTEYSNLATGLFQSRAEMHRRVYTHQKVKSIEFMVCDALALAQEPLGLRDAVAEGDLTAYLHLDDSLLQRLASLRPDDCDNPAAVREAQGLLDALFRRRLYKYVQELTLDPGQQARYRGTPSAEEIVGFASSAAHDGVQLRAEDVIVCETHIDQGMRGSNPMAGVRFYQTQDAAVGDRAFHMPQQQVSSMLGTVYQDKKVRVYSKDPDKRVCAALKAAFEDWAKARLGATIPGTPWRQPRSAGAPPGFGGGGGASGDWPPPHLGGGGGAVGGGGGGALCRPGSAGDLLCAGGAGDAGSGLAPDVAARVCFGDAAAGASDGDASGPEGAGGSQPLHAGSGGRSRKRSLFAGGSGGGAVPSGSQGSGGPGPGGPAFGSQQGSAGGGVVEPAPKHLAVVTCMDSRLLVDRMLPSVRLGDVEIMRNAGGRVTADVLRSLFAVMRHHDALVGRLRKLLSEWGVAARVAQSVVGAWAQLLLPRWARKRVRARGARPASMAMPGMAADYAGHERQVFAGHVQGGLFFLLWGAWWTAYTLHAHLLARFTAHSASSKRGPSGAGAGGAGAPTFTWPSWRGTPAQLCEPAAKTLLGLYGAAWAFSHQLACAHLARGNCWSARGPRRARCSGSRAVRAGGSRTGPRPAPPPRAAARRPLLDGAGALDARGAGSFQHGLMSGINAAAGALGLLALAAPAPLPSGAEHAFHVAGFALETLVFCWHIKPSPLDHAVHVMAGYVWAGLAATSALQVAADARARARAARGAGARATAGGRHRRSQRDHRRRTRGAQVWAPGAPGPVHFVAPLFATYALAVCFSLVLGAARRPAPAAARACARPGAGRRRPSPQLAPAATSPAAYLAAFQLYARAGWIEPRGAWFSPRASLAGGPVDWRGAGHAAAAAYYSAVAAKQRRAGPGSTSSRSSACGDLELAAGSSSGWLLPASCPAPMGAPGAGGAVDASAAGGATPWWARLREQLATGGARAAARVQQLSKEIKSPNLGMKVDVDWLNPAITGLKQQWTALPEPVREVVPFAGVALLAGVSVQRVCAEQVAHANARYGHLREDHALLEGQVRALTAALEEADGSRSHLSRELAMADAVARATTAAATAAAAAAAAATACTGGLPGGQPAAAGEAAAAAYKQVAAAGAAAAAAESGNAAAAGRRRLLRLPRFPSAAAAVAGAGKQ